MELYIINKDTYCDVGLPRLGGDVVTTRPLFLCGVKTSLMKLSYALVDVKTSKELPSDRPVSCSVQYAHRLPTK